MYQLIDNIRSSAQSHVCTCILIMVTSIQVVGCDFVISATGVCSCNDFLYSNGLNDLTRSDMELNLLKEGFFI